MYLRKEYEEYKAKTNQVIDESAVAWLKENVIYINESIDPKTIDKLNRKISKFDQIFDKFKEKVPALSIKLNEAELELQHYLTGTLSDKKAADLLEKLGYLYNIISGFLNSSLKVLLRTPILRAAKEHADVKLNVLDAPGHDADIIRKAFGNALRPGHEEMALIKKLYRGKKIELLDENLIALQLLNLSYNELLELTGVEKVPMISAEPLPSTSPETVSPELEAPASEAPPGTAAAPDDFLKEDQEDQEALEEVQIFNKPINTDLLKRVGVYSKALKALKSAPLLSRMPNLEKSITDLDVAVNKALTSRTSGAMNKISSMWGGDMDSRLTKLNQYLSMFVKIWDTVKEKYDLDVTDDETILSFNPDKTLSAFVTKVLRDKKLSEDVLAQTPQDLEEFSDSLTQYFQIMKGAGTPAAAKGDSTESTTPAEADKAPATAEKGATAPATGAAEPAPAAGKEAPEQAAGVDPAELAKALKLNPEKLGNFIKNLEAQGYAIAKK